MIYKEFIRG